MIYCSPLLPPKLLGDFLFVDFIYRISMKTKYTKQEKQQILEEVKNTKNIVVVAKKYNIPATTSHTWLHKLRHSSTMNNAL